MQIHLCKNICNLNMNEYLCDLSKKIHHISHMYISILLSSFSYFTIFFGMNPYLILNI